jgi:23S rRNA-/tRNA-specific pseudouridylate synthase
VSRTDFKILYEDENFLAIYKQPCVHSNGLEIKRAAQSFRAAHRLDYETQGLLLMASESSWKTYNELFLGRSIQKLYLAGASYNQYCLGKKEGFIASRYRSSKKTYFGENSQLFRSFHSVLEAKHIIRESSEKIKFSDHIYEVELITGRRHQIRSFFASQKNPLKGDKLYGDKGSQKTLELFSWKLKFLDPFSKKEISLQAPTSLFTIDEEELGHK